MYGYKKTLETLGINGISSLVIGKDRNLYIGGRGRKILCGYDLKNDKVIETNLSSRLELSEGEEIYRGLVITKDGNKVYGGTSIDETYLEFHHFDYPGGHLFEYDIGKEEVIDLGIPLSNESIKGLTISYNNRYLFGISFPSNHLFVYEINTGIIRDIGPISRKFRQGSLCICTETGYLYVFGTGDGEYGKFLKYHPENEHYEIIDMQLPNGDQCNYFSTLDVVISGGDKIYCSTYPWGDLLRFYPEKEEFEYIGRPSVSGEVEDIYGVTWAIKAKGQEGRLSCLCMDKEGMVFGAAGFGEIRLFSYHPDKKIFTNYGVLPLKQIRQDVLPHIQAITIDDKSVLYLGEKWRPYIHIYQPQIEKKYIFLQSEEHYNFEAKNVWVGSICSICGLLLSADEKRVYIGGTCKAGKGGLLAYYSLEDERIVDLHLEKYFPLEEKIHRSLAEGPDGKIYGGTGLNRDLTGENFEYPGGHLFSYDPNTEKIEDLGIPVKGDLIFALNIDFSGRYIYGGTYPSHHFFYYDLKKKQIVDKGCPSFYMFAYKYLIDKEGNVYFPGKEGYLVRYNPGDEGFRYTKAKLPDECFSFDCVVSHPEFGMYFSTHGYNGCDYIFRLNGEKEKLEYIGKPTRGRTPALGFDNESRLYMAHGSSKAYLSRYTYKTGNIEFLGQIVFNLRNEIKEAFRIHNLVVDKKGIVYLGETDYYRPENTYFYIARPIKNR